MLIERLFALLMYKRTPMSADSAPSTFNKSIRVPNVSFSVIEIFLYSPLTSRASIPAFFRVVLPHGVSNSLKSVSSVAVECVVTVL